MATYIETLKKKGNQILPRTVAKAVQMEDGVSVETKMAKKQDTLTFDTTPTASSINPVTSEGIKAYVDDVTNKQYQLIEEVTFDGETSSYVKTGLNLKAVFIGFEVPSTFSETQSTNIGSYFSFRDNCIWKSANYQTRIVYFSYDNDNYSGYAFGSPTGSFGAVMCNNTNGVIITKGVPLSNSIYLTRNSAPTYENRFIAINNSPLTEIHLDFGTNNLPNGTVMSVYGIPYDE